MDGGKPLTERKRENKGVNSGQYVYLATLMQRIRAAHQLRSNQNCIQAQGYLYNMNTEIWH